MSTRLPLISLLCLAACGSAARSDGGTRDAGSDAGVQRDGGTTSDGGTTDGGTFVCMVTAPTVCPMPEPTYDDIKPVLQQRCIVCHSGVPNGPWPLTDYPTVAAWGGDIRAELLDCDMPPLDAGIEMPAAETQLILEWVLCGMRP